MKRRPLDLRELPPADRPSPSGELDTDDAARLVAAILWPPPIDRNWLDGERLAAWICERHPGLRSALGCDYARITSWKSGTPAKLESVDKILTRLGSFPSEVPADCWIDPPGKRSREARKAAGEIPAKKRRKPEGIAA